ncbi:hypothetical protein D918_02957 [Trichuris suis]|nr:hypothetical protein D918_02957 [Trichuris suis]
MQKREREGPVFFRTVIARQKFRLRAQRRMDLKKKEEEKDFYAFCSIEMELQKFYAHVNVASGVSI